MLSRELTVKEKKIIKKSVQEHCACYDRKYGCLPLDSVCYMMTLGYNDSQLCKYYEKCILPLEVEICMFLKSGRENIKICRICGNKFLACRNQQYCSQNCALTARRKATARRMRKQRSGIR